ncbi:MAG TPA: HNH endonuclease signature motif containing protein [Baekduia sp.]|nr:HNH endonuclease signature motif containing protein [Baekduia sp.]
MQQRLAQLERVAAAGRIEREHLDTVVADLVAIQDDLFGPRRAAAKGEGARGKLLRYLLERVGDEVSGEQLRIVSGIQEWARRVRELRVEDGYEIVELGRSTYRLESAEPNKERAQQWSIANFIRKQPGSARSRIEKYLEANVGKVVTREQIDYVANIAEGSRRVRELRDEQGWPIASHVDDPDLAPGEYRLLSTAAEDRRDASQRLYPEDLRHQVFMRDNFTCRICGRDRAAAEAAGDRRFYLEVHHKVAMADELAALSVEERHDIDNLVTLCHGDHVRETAALHDRKRRSRGG